MVQNTSLKLFYDQAIGMLAEAASDRVPEQSLFSPAEMPGLVVHFGPSGNLPALRARLSDHCFLFGIHDDSGAVDVSGRSFLVRVDEEAVVEKSALLTSILPVKKVRILADDEWRERFSTKFEAVQKAVKTAIDNATSEDRRGLIRLRAACCNLRQMIAGPRIEPEMVSPDTPVILCGAGPSLASEIESIKALKDRVVIAAVGHAVRTLDVAGIVPDFIVEGDPLAGRNWPESLRPDSLLVATAEAAPDVTARFENILWCAGSSMPFNRLAAAFELPLFQVALNKTVSVHALDYLIRTGFRRVALIGQDYSFGACGCMYAEASVRPSADADYPLPSADGTGTVVSNETFKNLWEAFNRYLDAIQNIPGLELINGSSGAALNHTRVQSLSEWGASATGSRPDFLFRAVPVDAPSDALDRVVAELNKERRALDTALDSFKALTDELDRQPVQHTQLQLKQQAVGRAVDAETSQREKMRSAPWLHTLFHVVDQTMKETAGMLSADPDPRKQLRYLTRRYQMMDRLCLDLLDSLLRGRSPRRFNAFAEENLAAVAQSNPALADRLRSKLDAAPDSFDIHWFNQILPFVKRKQDDEWKDLSAFVSFFTEARDTVQNFVAQTGFNPQRDAVTVIAPGNWVYVYELLRRFPNINLAVIDPWSDLLAQLIQGGCFLNRLPPGACVAGTWADPVYVQCRNRWRARGLREVRFISPHVAEFPDVKALCRNLELLP